MLHRWLLVPAEAADGRYALCTHPGVCTGTPADGQNTKDEFALLCPLFRLGGPLRFVRL